MVGRVERSRRCHPGPRGRLQRDSSARSASGACGRRRHEGGALGDGVDRCERWGVRQSPRYTDRPDTGVVVLAALLGFDEFPDDCAELEEATELRWVLWDPGDAVGGWALHLAVEDPDDGIAWAISAVDMA